nr:MMPL family transporter [Euryarchaeota archaeon]
MRDFSKLAEVLVPQRKLFHISIFVISLLMLPGLMWALTPIDVEAYNLDSPEIEAREVITQEYPGNEIVAGYAIIIRDQTLVGDDPSTKYNNEIADYSGDGMGVSQPKGGILNLSVLQEIDVKAEAARADPISEFYRPIISDVTLTQFHGVLTLTDQVRTFMAGESLLTQPSMSPYGELLPPRTNWTDCGDLECLTFDDEGITQAHIDLAAQRMVNGSGGIFLRWLSLDRGFHATEDGTLGPVGGTLVGNGIWNNASWEKGRWSASSTWLLIQFDRGAAEDAGWTFEWAEARAESGYEWNGLRLITTPPMHDKEFCQASVESGEGPCAWEWAIISLEHSMRASDDLSLTIAVAEGINIEVNKELKESITLLAAMGLIVIVLLWGSLRRWSDVGIVSAGLTLSLLWMFGSIGWVGEASKAIGHPLIERSQFSNLLPILILALGIDDSLHVLHRYKEERKNGFDPLSSSSTSLSRVGRAILLTSVTTIAAFSANFVSDIPALRSFGLEAALGVGSAFVLTGLWAPLVRLDIDLWLEEKGKLPDEDKDKIHLIPSHWLAGVAKTSAIAGPLVILAALLLSAYSAPLMFGLEGDFKVEDFLDEESDFATVVHVVNERFYSEGEPAEILIEGDVIDPRVYLAIAETRANMNIHSESDPDRFTISADGNVDMSAYDRFVDLAILSMANNITPFVNAGWDSTDTEGGVGCNRSNFGLPMTDDEECLRFLVGFISVHGIPETNSTPAIPPSMLALYIIPDRPLDPANPMLALDGSTPRYERMLMRFGLRQPEQFPIVEKALEELYRDMSAFENLSSTGLKEKSNLNSAFSNEEYPVSWAIATGEPVARYVAASSLQNEMQSTLALGVFFCIVTLWWGFRPLHEELKERLSHNVESGSAWAFLSLIYAPLAVALTAWAVTGIIASPTIAIVFAVIAFYGTLVWGEGPLGLALLTTAPILLVVIWLYGLIATLGYGLNMVTVAIATLSLGVGIDYVIHVIERFREEHEKRKSVLACIGAVGSASGIALVGSAASDTLGFLVISFSPMGFFSLFGTFSAAMIFFSLIASLIIASGMLGITSYPSVISEARKSGD